MNATASQTRTHAGRYDLQVSRYDQTASMLIALLILLGVAVVLLATVWLTNQIFLGQAVVPVEIMEIGEGDGQLGQGMELEGPTDEEIGEETDLDDPAVQDTLAAIADAVGAQAALLADPALSEQMQSGKGAGSRGDGRIAGSGSGSGGIARHWEVRFIEGNTLDGYARQLDFFGIELGVLMPKNQVIYVANVSASQPNVRTGPADQEKRYYLTWRGGDLQQADRDLLGKAGVQSTGRIILKFLPTELEMKLYTMEKSLADARGQKARRTRFGIRPEGSGYEFYIMDQSSR